MGDLGPDVVVVFEAAYDTYLQHNTSDSIRALQLDRACLATIVHSLPANMTQDEMSTFVKEVRGVFNSVFVTDLATDMYSSFGVTWLKFVENMA